MNPPGSRILNRLNPPPGARGIGRQPPSAARKLLEDGVGRGLRWSRFYVGECWCCCRSWRGIAADMQELRAAGFGMLNTVGIFDPAVLSDPERAVCAERRDYFLSGEVASAAALAGAFTVPLGIFLAGKSGSLPAFIIAAMLFLLLFVFLPKLIRKGMNTDTDTIILLFGKNEKVKKVFWSVFIVLAGFVLAQVVDPGTAQAVLRLLTGTG